MLIGAQLTLPGPISNGVRADRPEIWAPTEKHAVSEDEHAAVAAPNAVEHINVNRIKPVLHWIVLPLVRARRYSPQRWTSRKGHGRANWTAATARCGSYVSQSEPFAEIEAKDHYWHKTHMPIARANVCS